MQAAAKAIEPYVAGAANGWISDAWYFAARLFASEVSRVIATSASAALAMDLVVAGVIRFEDLFSYQQTPKIKF